MEETRTGNENAELCKETTASNLQTGSCSPELDAGKYRDRLDEYDLTEEQKTELLQVLWSIMKTFVDLGFGVESIHYFCRKSA